MATGMAASLPWGAGVKPKPQPWSGCCSLRGCPDAVGVQQAPRALCIPQHQHVQSARGLCSCSMEAAPLQGEERQGAPPAMLPGSRLSDGSFRAGKQQGRQHGDFPDAPVLLCSVLAQITPSAQADLAPTFPCAGEVHIQLCKSTADLWGDGCAKLYSDIR